MLIKVQSLKLFLSYSILNGFQTRSQRLLKQILRYGDVGSGLNVKCEFLLNDKEAQDLINTIFPNKPNSNADRIYKIFIPCFSNPILFFQWQDHPNQTHIKLRPIFIRGGYFSKKIPSGGTTGHPNEFIDLFIEGKSIDEALNVKEVWDSPNIQQTVSRLLLKKFHRFTDFRFRPSNPKRTSELESFQGNETANVLLNLKNHHDSKQRAKYEEIRSEFATFFPNLTMDAIETGPASNIADIQVLETGKNYTARINQVGSGVAEILTLITNLLGRKDEIIVIEEPESHLHPQSKRRLYELIKKSSTENQIFVITHDSFFVDPDRPDSISRIFLSEKGSQLTKIDEQIPEKTNAQLKTALKDVAKRELVFSRAVLFVEDESQKNVLLGFAKTLDYELDKYCVSIISCDGHDGYKPYLPLVKALQIPYIFLRDKPWGQSEDKKIFRSFGCELEDFLKKNDFSSLLKEAQKEVGDSKQRMARYIGEKASKDQIPQFFSDLLEDILKLSNKKKYLKCVK